jgi:hypothetical protein
MQLAGKLDTKQLACPQSRGAFVLAGKSPTGRSAAKS